MRNRNFDEPILLLIVIRGLNHPANQLATAERLFGHRIPYLWRLWVYGIQVRIGPLGVDFGWWAQRYINYFCMELEKAPAWPGESTGMGRYAITTTSLLCVNLKIHIVHGRCKGDMSERYDCTRQRWFRQAPNSDLYVDARSCRFVPTSQDLILSLFDTSLRCGWCYRWPETEREKTSFHTLSVAVVSLDWH